MADRPDSRFIAAAIARTRLQAVSLGLVKLHKALLDAERVRYEREHGRVETAGQMLTLAMEDPWFAWLRPIGRLIVQIDGRLAEDGALPIGEVDALLDEAVSLLRTDRAGAEFYEAYQRDLQEFPDVVVAHGKLTALLTGK